MCFTNSVFILSHCCIHVRFLHLAVNASKLSDLKHHIKLRGQNHISNNARVYRKPIAPFCLLDRPKPIRPAFISQKGYSFPNPNPNPH